MVVVVKLVVRSLARSLARLQYISFSTAAAAATLRLCRLMTNYMVPLGALYLPASSWLPRNQQVAATFEQI